MNTELMKAVIITEPGTASLQQIERWTPEPGEVLVRCKATAICTTERRVFSGDLPRYPVIGGHEFAGIIEWVGETDSDLKPGDHVAIDAVTRCGRCYYCLKGHNNLCVDMYKSRKDTGYILIGGGFAEYAAVLRRQVVKLPDQVNLEEASLIEPLACCIHSLKKARLSLGETVAIIGAGTMGTMHVMLAKLLGARVIVSDIDEDRLNLARHVGADVTVNPKTDDPVQVVKDHTEGRGADAVIVAASAKPAGQQGLAMVGKVGRLIFYASLYPSGTLELDWNYIHYQELTLSGTEGKTNTDFYEAATLVGSGAVNLRPLISRVIPLDELPDELGAKPAGSTQRVVVKL